ncbi:hypothetical protein [Glycomyces buryatensis]|uniref:Uncharacterized protein n=1 Tax=Glycomyces buryatensis TaxID=2570927 RepID=A0A4S8QA42_9ACTN|nr:hypothetical protein [Glycomyces buryatensis]THV39635.1 hypothetical protein FAB82_17345 [Glycomyces buryatensis]
MADYEIGKYEKSRFKDKNVPIRLRVGHIEFMRDYYAKTEAELHSRIQADLSNNPELEIITPQDMNANRMPQSPSPRLHVMDSGALGVNTDPNLKHVMRVDVERVCVPIESPETVQVKLKVGVLTILREYSVTTVEELSRSVASDLDAIPNLEFDSVYTLSIHMDVIEDGGNGSVCVYRSLPMPDEESRKITDHMDRMLAMHDALRYRALASVPLSKPYGHGKRYAHTHQLKSTEKFVPVG